MTLSRTMNRVKRTGTGRPAQPPPYFGPSQQDKAECAASAPRVTASRDLESEVAKNVRAVFGD